MWPTRKGAFHLFRFAGIDVYLHYSWFLLALAVYFFPSAIGVDTHGGSASSYGWVALEYFALFSIVLMHEFGHALACRSVGGIANQIILWPLGGVAYVDPPRRPGATLWSIAAGPLVNVVLFPILSVFAVIAKSTDLGATFPNVYEFIKTVWVTNLVLLIFNMLPVYPLDGGQILQSLLWFMVGRARSLLIVSIIGFIGVAGFMVLSVASGNPWLGLLAGFAGLQCWNGYQAAQALIRLEKAPRHLEFACPACDASPPRGPYWTCQRCRAVFDTFDTNAVCPNCQAVFTTTKCIECGTARPIQAWVQTTLVQPPVVHDT
jgi:Zn-dependent protease